MRKDTMSKLLEVKNVKLTGIYDPGGNETDDWQNEYLDLIGLLCIYESLTKAPGKKYFYFYPNEPDNPMQRYLHSSLGDFNQRDKTITFISKNHIYVFAECDILSNNTQLNCGDCKRLYEDLGCMGCRPDDSAYFNGKLCRMFESTKDE